VSIPSGIDIQIPFFAEPLRITRIVSDYTGTLSFHGRLIPGVQDRLGKLQSLVTIDVLTADSSGTAKVQLGGMPFLGVQIFQDAERHDVRKQAHAEKNNPAQIAAFGNGNNDALLLKTVKAAGGLAVAVDNGEGCSVEAMQNANIFIVGIVNALDLIIERTWCKATLRR
jgi:soluble P-type ATPase